MFFGSRLFGSCFQRSKTMEVVNNDTLSSVPSIMGDGVNNKRYKSLNKIGSGGSAMVWKSIDTHTMEVVAMKVSSMHHGNTELENEFFLLRKFNNPHIISPIAFYYDRRSRVTSHMILPFMNKDLFTHVIDEGRYMNEKELRKLVIDIADGIKHIHDRGVIHRDIKPENILIDTNGTYVLCDFGCAEWDDSISFNKAKGTLNYMAPEVATAYVKNNKNEMSFIIGKSMDIFSFGMTLYNIATRSAGGPTRVGKSSDVFMNEISKFDMMPYIDELTDRSAAFSDLLKMMLYRSPVARITVEEILDHPFVTGSDAMLTSDISTHRAM